MPQGHEHVVAHERAGPPALHLRVHVVHRSEQHQRLVHEVAALDMLTSWV